MNAPGRAHPLAAWLSAALVLAACAGSPPRPSPGPAASEASGQADPGRSNDPDPATSRLLVAYQSNLGGEIEACG